MLNVQCCGLREVNRGEQRFMFKFDELCNASAYCWAWIPSTIACSIREEGPGLTPIGKNLPL
jgi:hypothetical protein